MKKEARPWFKMILQGTVLTLLTVSAAPAALAAVEDTGFAASKTAIQTKISREQAIEIALKSFSIPTGANEPEVSLDRWSEEADAHLWRITWRIKEEDANISVHIDANTGDIVEFSQWMKERDAQTFPPKVTYEQAVAIAAEWLKKLYPDVAEFFEHAPENEHDTILRRPGDQYSIIFKRVINGIPFADHWIHVRVNGNGMVTAMDAKPLGSFEWPEKTSTVASSEILKRAEQQVQMKLAYTRKRIDYEGRNIEQQISERILAYIPDGFPRSLYDATTGEPIDYSGREAVTERVESGPLGKSTAARQPVKRSKPVSENEALDILNAFYKLPQEVTVESIRLSKDEFFIGRQIWRINLLAEVEDEEIEWTAAFIDAETGEVLRFDMTDYLEEKQWIMQKKQKGANKSALISPDKAKEKAFSYIMSTNGDKLDQLYWESYPLKEETPQLMYRFSFNRKINGILIDGDVIRVTVSGETGEVVGYFKNWSDLPALPEMKGAITLQQAKERYLQDASAVLEYRLFKRKPEQADIKQEKPKMEPRLVYRYEVAWKGIPYVDAQSGKVMDRETGREAAKRFIQSKDEIPADIKGHSAEKELLHLVKLQALQLEENLVQPEKRVTRAEFLDMLLRTFGDVYDYGYDDDDDDFYYESDRENAPSFQDVDKDHKYFAAVERAVQHKVIAKEKTTFQPDRPITREEAVEFVVNALGYQALAKHDRLFQLPFADKEQIAYKGHVAIANELGLLQESGGSFKPRDEVTRAEAAQILYRLLAKQAVYSMRRF